MEALYEIPDRRLGKLKATVEELNTRARKIGVPPLGLEVLSSEERAPDGYEDDLRSQFSRPRVRVLYHRVRLTGETPKMAGWTFLAVLEQHGEAGNVVRVVPGQVLPEGYRAVESWCDHCQVTRRRNETYVVRHDDGRHLQVGSTCVKDFLGGCDPHKLAEWLAILWQADILIASDDDGEDRGPCSEPRFDPLEVLMVTSVLIRKNGWTSRKRAQETNLEPTASQVQACLLSRKYPADMLESDKSTATAAYNWAWNLEPRGEYEHNLKALCTRGGWVHCRDLGLLCSTISAWAKVNEMVVTGLLWAKKVKPTSEYQGEVGKRREWDLTMTRVSSSEGSYGTTHIYRMADEAGNIFTWFASNEIRIDGREAMAGDKLRLKATVKKHEEYRGIKQTILTRATVLETRVAATSDKDEEAPLTA